MKKILLKKIDTYFGITILLLITAIVLMLFVLQSIDNAREEIKEWSFTIPQKNTKIQDFIIDFYEGYNNQMLSANGSTAKQIFLAQYAPSLIISEKNEGFDPVTCSQDIMVNPQIINFSHAIDTATFTVVGDGNSLSNPIITLDISNKNQFKITDINCS